MQTQAICGRPVFSLPEASSRQEPAAINIRRKGGLATPLLCSFINKPSRFGKPCISLDHTRLLSSRAGQWGTAYESTTLLPATVLLLRPAL